MTNPRPESGPQSDQFALLVDAVEDYAIFLLSPEGEILTWNRGAARTMGYSAEEILGKPFSTFYTDQDLRNRKPERELETAAAKGRIEDEGWRVRKDGQRFWANTVITALRNDQGQVTGFAKVTRDLTERRSAEERLRESEELFRQLVGSVRDYAIFMLDPNGNVTTWNAGAHRIKGYKADEIIGRHFSTFYPEEDVRARKPERELEIAREVGSVEDEGWRVRQDGSRFWANVIITAVRDATGELRGFAKVTRDITERKQADEMRQALLEQREARLQAEEGRRHAEAQSAAANEANRAKDEFLMTLSHELRTPMTAILGWARLLPRISPNDEMFAEAVGSIGRSATVQAQLLDDVLDVSRIVSGKLRLTLETLEVGRVVAASVDAVRPMADARSVTIAISIEPNVGLLVADPTRLQQVVWNLLTNAVKFSPKGGTVELSASRTSSHVLIKVQDHGAGIDREFLPHVFEPFRQAESPSTRVHGGLGLGLSIVRYLVEAHGGSVTAESQGRGHGSTFTAELPVAAISPPVSDEKTERAVRRAAPIDPQRLQQLRILLVDDDREARLFVRTVLQEAGAEVTVVNSADAALEQFEAEAPDLMLTDIAMPGSDGYQLARTIRDRTGGKKVKIVALSAFPAGSGAADQSGFDGYLRKPIDPTDLVEAIANLAGRRRDQPIC